MDQFEAAKLKALKRIERNARYAAPQISETQPAVPPDNGCGPAEAAEVPMEKEPVTAAIIEVKVTLPTGEFGFKFVKPAVMNNANPSKLTKAGFRNCILEGLRPLLGGLNDLP